MHGIFCKYMHYVTMAINHGNLYNELLALVLGRY